MTQLLHSWGSTPSHPHQTESKCFHEFLHTHVHSITSPNRQNVETKEFSGGPVVRASSFHCRGLGSIPVWGTKILPAVSCGQKKKGKGRNKPNVHQWMNG